MARLSGIEKRYRKMRVDVGALNIGGYSSYPVLDQGTRYFVSSVTGASGNDGSLEAPVLTVTAAVALCTANQGDEIHVLQNHAETITGVSGLTIDKAGISIIGHGTYNQRPRLLMDGGTTVTALVSAADVYIDNIEMASGHLLVATGFDVTGKGFWANRIHFTDNTTAENWGSPFKATGAANTADGLTITNCRWTPLVATVNALEFVEITDDIRDLTIDGNFIVHEGTASPLVLQAGTKVMHTAQITNNYLSHKMTTGDLVIDNGGATNSGVVAYNLFGHANVGGAHEIGAATGMRFFENKSVSTAVLSGFLLPAADVGL